MGKHIDSYLWIFVGCALGALAGATHSGKSKVFLIESMLVGIFGAFVGGDFLVAMLWGPKAGGISALGLAMAVVGAVVMLMLLSVMRRAVGPMRPAKKRASTRR